MKPFAIFYATREGQTRSIAEHLARALEGRGRVVDLQQIAKSGTLFDASSHDAVIVAGSVHLGSHEHELTEFVRRNRDPLEAVPSVFVSVSLSEASAHDPRRSEAERAAATGEVQRLIHRFLGDSGWRPKHVLAAAGALPYSRYNFLVRFLMKRIAKKAALSTDTSLDHEFTDWKALDLLVDRLLDELRISAPPPAPQPESATP